MKQDSMKIGLINEVWYSNMLSNMDRLKSRQVTESCSETQEKDFTAQLAFHEVFGKTDFYEDQDDCNVDTFGYTVLQNTQIACFDSGGEKLLCLPQVLELIGDTNIFKIKLTIEKLGIILTECSPMKLEVLFQNHILQSKATSCGLISQSNAERLCKIFSSSQKRYSESKQIISQNYFIPLKYRHKIRVVHDCFGQQKGILMPQLCTNVNAQCIECFDCGVWFSPSDFVGHTHNQSGLESEISTCHWGFISSNWKLYLRLAEDSSRTVEEERSLNDYLNEIKNRYIQPIYDSLTISNDHDQHTPSDSCSFNTSPSMPTPNSLSPSDGLNKSIDLQNSSSIFQQCLMRICKNHLESFDDRNQLINTLFMLRQEHHQQISTLISERQELMRALKKNPVTIVNQNENRSLEEDEIKPTLPTDNFLNTLQSVKQKIAILKRSCIKRGPSLSVQNDNQINEKVRKTANRKETDFRESELSFSDNSQPTKEVIVCDSSSIRAQLTEKLSCHQQQEMGND